MVCGSTQDTKAMAEILRKLPQLMSIMICVGISFDPAHRDARFRQAAEYAATARSRRHARNNNDVAYKNRGAVRAEPASKPV